MIKNLFKIILLALFLSKLTANEIILDNEFYKVVYDTKLGSAVKVSYSLDQKVNEKNLRKRPTFKADKRLVNPIKPSDYAHSGFDKGHLASDGSFDWSEESLESVYLMSNIVPQYKKINEGIWRKIENRERALALKYQKISVVNLVEFSKNPKKINGKIPIPKSFVKIIYTPNNTECYRVFNRNKNYTLKQTKLKDCSKFKKP